jgi:hypothetical protein
MWIGSVFPPKNLFVRIGQVSRIFWKIASWSSKKSISTTVRTVAYFHWISQTSYQFLFFTSFKKNNPTLVWTSVVRLSQAYPVDINKLCSHFLKQEAHVFQNIWNLSHHSVTHFYFYSSYEYADFQFSQNDGYAQGLYISIFSFYSYKKSRINVCVMCSHSKKAVICCKVQSANTRLCSLFCKP